MNKTVLVMPDLHTPYEQRAAWKGFLRAVTHVQPDEVLILGDFMDTKAPARWSRGRAAEYANDLEWEIKNAVKRIDELRKVHDGKVSFIEGNHEARISTYLHTYAPAFVGVMPTLPELLKFSEYEVDFEASYRQKYRVAPGVDAIHGNKLSSTLNASAQSAFKERQRHGVSIVQGHTHRLGLGFDTQDKTRFWMEAGCLCDINKMEYLDYEGMANWQLGCGLLHVVGGTTYPSIHYIKGGKIPSLGVV